VLGFDGLQFLEQLVVLGIGNARRIEHVVLARMVFELRAQLLGARLRVRPSAHGPS
jgi:hypothetical protein